MRRIVFAHGLASSPNGTKASYLTEELGAVAPALGHLDLGGQADALEAALSPKSGSVLIGSSLGGLAALSLANRAPRRIAHLLLLAPAMSAPRRENEFMEAERQRPGLYKEAVEAAKLSIPKSVPATIVHGVEDEIVALEDVIALAVRSESCRLILIHDDHQLTKSRELILSIAGRVATGEDPMVFSRGN